MTDVNELMADTDHARKAIERLAGMKLYEISEEQAGNLYNPANPIVVASIKEHALDREKIREITYIETLFLLNEMREDICKADAGKHSCQNPSQSTDKNALDDYLFRVNLLCALVQRNVDSCPWLKIVCATPLETLCSALSDIGGAQCDSELWNAYKKTIGEYKKNKTITAAKEDNPSLKDVMIVFITSATKRWIPGDKAISAYERETREAFIDLSRLFVEIPLCAFKNRISVTDVIDKYTNEGIDQDEEICSFEEPWEELPFN